MGIHDVNKGEHGGAPTPNAHDKTDVPRPAHGTNSVNYQTAASPSSTGPGIFGGNARLVASGVARVVTPDGATGTITQTTTTVPHNLGFAPIPWATMNNSAIGGQGAFNIPLPLMVSLGNNTGGTGGASEYLGLIRWMYYAVDGTNFYIITYSSGVAIAATYDITYYLYQQRVQ